MKQEKINRINELARKSREKGLTPEELEEQKLLRAEYISDFRRDLQATLDRTYITGKDGKETKLPRKSKK